MRAFSRFHPSALLAFFALSFILPSVIHNPLFTFASLAAAVLTVLITGCAGAGATSLMLVFPIGLTALSNFIFVHYGSTVLLTLFGSDLTLEALLYGAEQGALMSSMLLWFILFGVCFDGEKVVYVFRHMPKTGLIFSMVLGFIPRFLKKLRDIRTAELALCGGKRDKKIKARLKTSLRELAALLSYCLESSIITGESMSARGYKRGTVRRARFTYTPYDALFTAAALLLGAFVIFTTARGYNTVLYEPVFSFKQLSAPSLAAFGVLELMPLIIILKEGRIWKQSSAGN